MPFSSERPYAARSTCDPSSRTILAAYVFRGCAATSSTVFFWIFSDFFWFYVIIITLFILNLHKRYNTKHAQNFIFFTKNRWFFKWIMLCKFHSEWCSITFTLKLHLHFYYCQFYFRYSFRNGHKKRHRFFPMPMACK